MISHTLYLRIELPRNSNNEESVWSSVHNKVEDGYLAVMEERCDFGLDKVSPGPIL